jgi:hypothetical protein
VIVDLHRNHPRSPGYVSTDHQHNAELSHRVCKTEDRRRDEAGAGQWQDDGEKAIPWTGAQCGRGFERPWPDRFESILQRLHDEWHRIEYRADHEPEKRKG